MNTIIKGIISASFLILILASSLIFPFEETLVDAASSVLAGFSGYPMKVTNVQNIINTMENNGLNIYRMSFTPEWYSTKPRPYDASIVQYFLDKSNYLVVVDRNHLYPPTTTSAETAKTNWNVVKNSIFEVLQTWPNNSRVAVELINEYVDSDFYSLMQQLVTEIREAGYTNPIVVNKFDQRWTKIIDPLDNTYQGYHFYFNYWSVSGAISQMKTALSKGIKIINTEVGADSRDYRYFTAETVMELSDFLNQSAALGVSNCVWLSQYLGNWQKYESLGLVFPGGSPQPVLHEISFGSQEDNSATSNLGTISCDGAKYSLPVTIQKAGVTYPVTFTSDYTFSRWVTSGLVSVEDVNSPSTTMEVSGKGELIAVYYLPQPTEYKLDVQVTGVGSINATDTVYVAGTSVAVVATAGSGWVLSHWLLNGTNVGSVNPYVLTIDANYDLTAVFSEVQIEYSLTIVVVGSGTVAKSPNSASYAAGSAVQLTAFPNTGYFFAGWSGDLIGTTNPATITMNSNKTITATFTQILSDYLLEDSFESGSLALWDGRESSASVSTVNPYQGTYHLRSSLSAGANNGWSGVYKSVSGINPVSVSAYVYFNAPPNTNNEDQWVLCLSSSTAGNAMAYAGLRRVSETLYWSIWYINSGTTFVYQISSAVYSTGWHHLELGLYRGTSNDGWVKLFVDGEETCWASNLDNDARALNYARVGFSYSDAPSTASTTVYIDNVRIDS